MANLRNALTWDTPIVDEHGRPTPEFMSKWQQQTQVNANIPVLSTPAQVSAVLDILANTDGDLLRRGTSEWAALAAGTAGQYLGADGTYSQPPIRSPLTTKGDLYGYDTDNARIPVGTDGQVLSAASSEALGVKWVAQSGGGGAVVVSGVPTQPGQYVGQLALDSAHGTLYGWAASPVVPLGVVQIATRGSTSIFATGLSPVFSNSLTVGNVVVMFVVSGGGSNYNTTAWPQHQHIGSSWRTADVFAADITGAGTTLPDFTTSSSMWTYTAIALEVAGATPANTLTFALGSNKSNPVSFTTAGETAGAMVIACAGIPNHTGTPAASGGFTQDFSGTQTQGQLWAGHAIVSGSPISESVSMSSGAVSTARVVVPQSSANPTHWMAL